MALTCRLCGSRATVGVAPVVGMFDGNPIRRRRCLACDVVYGPVDTIDLPREALAARYRALYTSWAESETTVFVADTFRRLSPGAGRYLNFGAGVCDRKALGFPHAEVVAYDPFREPVTVGGVFDGIFSHNVIEHLQYPVMELSALRDMLKPGGLMVHSTECFEYKITESEFHLFFFLGRSTKVIARLAGLEWCGLVPCDVEGSIYHALTLRRPL